jgi:hypothetical protein
MDWRRNQLKQPEEGGGLVDTLGKIALGAGALAAGIAGYRTLRGRYNVTPATVQVREEAVRRAAKPLPQLRGSTTATPTAAPKATPPQPSAPTSTSILRDIVLPSAPPRTQAGGGLPDPWPGAAAVEEQFVAYRPDPKEPVSQQVANARRQAATEQLLKAAEARRGTYQPEIPGIKSTLMELRTPVVSAEEAGELVAQAESRSLSIAPEQKTLFEYVKTAAEPEGDVADRLLQEYGQLVERQARADRRAQSSVRQYQMELQGKAMRVLDDIRQESKVQASPLNLDVSSRLKSAGLGMEGAPEAMGGSGVSIYSQKLNRSLPLSDPTAQTLLSQAGLTAQDANNYWATKLNPAQNLVEVQETKRAFNVDQAINALDASEDQMTGRVRQQLQRNEDLDLGTIDAVEDQTNNINVAASMTPDGIPVDQAESSGRIDQLVEQGKRYLRQQEIDLDYDYGPENRRQTAQVNDRIARALELKNTAERIIQEEAAKPSLVDTARARSAVERAKLASQGLAGEKLERQLLENMRANFPEGKAVMAPLQEETRQIERVGFPSQLVVRENIGSVKPLMQGEPERVTSPASQQAQYEGGIRGMSRSTREDMEERGGGLGVYGIEPAYAAGAVRKRGEFGESDYGDLGYEYSATALRRPTELTGKPGLEALPNPYSRLSDQQLGELTLYGSDADKYNAEQQLKKRASVDVSTRLRTLQLSNRPGEAENFLTRFKQGLI